MQRPNAAASRKKEYKKGVDAEDARRKREDNIIELRKIKRDENLQKKRQVHAGPSYALSDSTRSSATEVQAQVCARGGQRQGASGEAEAESGRKAARRAPPGARPIRAPAPTGSMASYHASARPAAGRAARHGAPSLPGHPRGAVQRDAEVQEAALYR